MYCETTESRGIKFRNLKQPWPVLWYFLDCQKINAKSSTIYDQYIYICGYKYNVILR